ncbi:FtsK/SpoIIIE domain-containing protein [Paenibacillus odorifer]|uniref:FtsK domain-containing protein n=1 Tax=Paenibacillus odorifer TaxID=189426 RepID=A0A1R0Y9J9_9BACL|nr:FtsK/SpoIIIE domain-containing protein [Paenibacillus odorifer]OMD44056.1 hypothetical protein BSK52_00455 [Paenibacillus odorifer]
MNSILSYHRLQREDDETFLINFLEDLDGQVQTNFDLCPEPVGWIHEFRNEQTLVGKESSIRQKFIRSTYNTDTMSREARQPLSDYWSGSTENGINLRPGEVYNPRTNKDHAPIPHKEVREKYSPVSLNDVAVHGLIGGRTGSGKSVFLNNLICNLMTEYAPWELDLFLADFKKVELSRYASNSEHIAPHLVACAATSNIAYVISLLDYIVKCMKAREKLFQKLNITHIKNFRKQFNVVLPRILLIVDEFQQLFLEASGKQTLQIQELLTSITKLGRATGVHLLFASQEMSGTLAGNVISNFKARFALPCDHGTSSSLIGNGAAAALEDKGIVIANIDGGDVNQNLYYRVPLIQDDDVRLDTSLQPWEQLSEFDEALARLAHLSSGWQVHDPQGKAAIQRKPMKYFDEDVVRPWKQENEHNSIIAGYRNDRYKAYVEKYLEKDPILLESLVLGDSVTYTPKKNDVQTCFLTKGARRHIAIAASSPANAAYIEKLLLENLNTSHQSYIHVVVDCNPLLTGVYDLQDDIEKHLLMDVCSAAGSELGDLHSNLFKETFFGTQLMEQYELDQCPKVMDRNGFIEQVDGLSVLLPFLSLLSASPEWFSVLSTELEEIGLNREMIIDWRDIECYMDIASNIDYSELYEAILHKSADTEEERIKPSVVQHGKRRPMTPVEFSDAVLQADKRDQMMQTFMDELRMLANEDILDLFRKSSAQPLIVLWYRGIESADKEAVKEIEKALKGVFAKRNDVICIMTAITTGQDTTSFDSLIRNYTNLRFCKSPIEKVYHVIGMDYSKQQNDESPVFDFKVINANNQRMFKRFQTELRNDKMHEIDWEQIEA